MIRSATLQRIAEIVMVLGIVALCQPWNLFLHRYGLTIIIVGLLTFMFTGWFGAGSRSTDERSTYRKTQRARMTQIELRGVQKFFGAVQVIKDLNLKIEDNEFIVLLGQSGCGKTTTLRAIAGLETIDEGDILIDGKPVQHLKASDRDIAMVFQSFSLYPHMTVYENIAFPLRATRMSKAEDRQGGARDRQGAAASPTCSTGSRRRCRAATCSASPSAARWCGGRRRC